ncbi:MAG: hypothetical protein Q9227_001723 [Pyrenula ochraceoflavens]
MKKATIRQILRIPHGEIGFNYPEGFKTSTTDKKYERLRIEQRRGLRRWTCFEENPDCLLSYLRQPSPYPVHWRPQIVSWQRLATSERMVQDLYASTLIHRVNVALHATIPSGLAIIGTPKHFPSLGTEASKGGRNPSVAPDWVVVYGDPDDVPVLEIIDTKVIVWGDTKLRKDPCGRFRDPLPGTTDCPESHLAQVVQYCLDSNVRFGFVLTNNELVVFQLVRTISEPEERPHTRSSQLDMLILQMLPSDRYEPEFSSPMRRGAADWLDFEDGDEAIPFVSNEDIPQEEKAVVYLDSSPPLPATLNLPSSPPQLSLDPEETPRRIRFRCPMTPELSSETSYHTDVREEDATYVLIKSCPAEKETVARRLFEFCMLAKWAKDLNLLSIGPSKLSFSALENLSSQSE